MRLLGHALGIALLSVATHSSAEPPDPHTAFAASFRYAGDAREQAVRRAAIDQAVGGLFFAIRPIARSRLDAGTRIDPSVAFAFAQGNIRVRLPPAPDAVSPESGAAVDYVDDNGEKSRLSQSLVSGKLAQIYATDDGRRTNEWALSPDGNTLTLRVNVSSPKLTTALVYSLTYKKVP